MKGTTDLNRHQKGFLRRLREHPLGLPAQGWPRVEVMQRWLAHPGFVARLHELKSRFEMAAWFSTRQADAMSAVQLANALGDGRFDDVQLLLQVLNRGTHHAGRSTRELASAEQVLQRLSEGMADDLTPQR